MEVSRMLNDLVDSGLSEGEIATRVGSTQPTVHRIKSGKTADPHYQVGKAIERLYRDRFPNEPTSCECMH
jgi:predicted transcriptional regulator